MSPLLSPLSYGPADSHHVLDPSCTLLSPSGTASRVLRCYQLTTNKRHSRESRRSALSLRAIARVLGDGNRKPRKGDRWYPKVIASPSCALTAQDSGRPSMLYGAGISRTKKSSRQSSARQGENDLTGPNAGPQRPEC